MHKNARQEGVEYSPQNVIWLNIFLGMREHTAKCFESHKKVQFWANGFGCPYKKLKSRAFEILCTTVP